MAKNTTHKVSTEAFIESVVEKILQKQSAQGQANYVQEVDRNGNPVHRYPQGILTTNVDPNAEPVSVYPSANVYNTNYTPPMHITGSSNTPYYPNVPTDVGISAKKASPVDDALMNLEENIHHTYDLIQRLVKKLEPVTFVAPANDTAQEIKPQHTIPLCATIERNTSIVVNIKKEIEYLLEYVGV